LTYQFNFKHPHKQFLIKFDENMIMVQIFYDLKDQFVTKNLND